MSTGHSRGFIPTFLFAFLSALSFSSVLASEKKVNTWALEAPVSVALKSGILQIDIVAKKADAPLKLTVAAFQDSEFEMVVLDNGRQLSRPRFQSLEAALLQSNCVAGSNGSLFSRSLGKPKGLVISEGRRNESFDPNARLAGAVAVRNGRLFLESIDGFKDDGLVTQLVQSGPWLVLNGEACVEAGTRRSQRTFVATDGGGGWILGHADHCTLWELGCALACPDFQKVMRIRNALNLDGGSSAGWWIRRDGKDVLYLEELSTVMNFIGIRRRP